MNLGTHRFSGLSCVQERRYDQFARRAVRAREQGRRRRCRSVRRLVLADGLQVMNQIHACFLLQFFGAKNYMK